MNIVIIGTGYVGLVAGLGYAKLGNKVACVDIDQAKIAKLDMGEAPFFEPEISDLLSELQQIGSIVFTTDLGSVLSDAEVVMIAVGTPSTANGDANLTYIFDAADKIGSLIDHEIIIATKSTVPVGTNRRIIECVRAAMDNAGRSDLTDLIQIASLPEFLREGSALNDFFFPDRIVIGTEDEIVRTLLDNLHEGIQAPRVFMGLESAELTKYASNAFLATKISFINEIANIAERVGADVQEVANAIGMDQRIAPDFLRAGIGYGGSCFPKDVSALHQIAGTSGYGFKLLSAVIEVNNSQRELFLRKIENKLGGFKGRNIAVWGLAFKNGTDDVRESIAIDLVQRIFARGAEVKVYDPQAMDNAKKLLHEKVQFAQTAIDAASGAEALIILTEWPEFRDVSIETLFNQMIEPRIFDGKNLLADKHLERYGFEYYGIGINR
ncbi:MAG: UDP-glucose/GDP-mannose dehydrogenase family protein [Patescibacteria group bacterium]